MTSILESLKGGDRRSIGKAAIAAQAAARPHACAELVAAMSHPDDVVRMRAADAVEKASRKQPELLAPHKRALLRLMAEATQQELRWHLAQMISRVPLSREERRGAVSVLKTYLKDRSVIVRTFALQALTDLLEHQPDSRDGLIKTLRHATTSRRPAIRARARKLLRRLCHAGVSQTVANQSVNSLRK